MMLVEEGSTVDPKDPVVVKLDEYGKINYRTKAIFVSTVDFTRFRPSSGFLKLVGASGVELDGAASFSSHKQPPVDLELEEFMDWIRKGLSRSSDMNVIWRLRQLDRGVDIDCYAKVVPGRIQETGMNFFFVFFTPVKKSKKQKKELGEYMERQKQYRDIQQKIERFKEQTKLLYRRADYDPKIVEEKMSKLKAAGEANNLVRDKIRYYKRMIRELQDSRKYSSIVKSLNEKKLACEKSLEELRMASGIDRLRAKSENLRIESERMASLLEFQKARRSLYENIEHGQSRHELVFLFRLKKALSEHEIALKRLQRQVSSAGKIRSYSERYIDVKRYNFIHDRQSLSGISLIGSSFKNIQWEEFYRKPEALEVFTEFCDLRNLVPVLLCWMDLERVNFTSLTEKEVENIKHYLTWKYIRNRATLSIGCKCAAGLKEIDSSRNLIETLLGRTYERILHLFAEFKSRDEYITRFSRIDFNNMVEHSDIGGDLISHISLNHREPRCLNSKSFSSLGGSRNQRRRAKDPLLVVSRLLSKLLSNIKKHYSPRNGVIRCKELGNSKEHLAWRRSVGVQIEKCIPLDLAGRSENYAKALLVNVYNLIVLTTIVDEGIPTTVSRAHSLEKYLESFYFLNYGTGDQVSAKDVKGISLGKTCRFLKNPFKSTNDMILCMYSVYSEYNEVVVMDEVGYPKQVSALKERYGAYVQNARPGDRRLDPRTYRKKGQDFMRWLGVEYSKPAKKTNRNTRLVFVFLDN